MRSNLIIQSPEQATGLTPIRSTRATTPAHSVSRSKRAQAARRKIKRWLQCVPNSRHFPVFNTNSRGHRCSRLPAPYKSKFPATIWQASRGSVSRSCRQCPPLIDSRISRRRSRAVTRKSRSSLIRNVRRSSASRYVRLLTA